MKLRSEGSRVVVSRIVCRASLTAATLCVACGATLLNFGSAVAQTAATQALTDINRINPTQVTPTPAPPPPGGVGLSVLSAQAQAPANAAKVIGVVRRAVVVDGFPELASETAGVVARIEGRRVSLADVYAAAAEIQRAYVAADFPLVTVKVQRADFRTGQVRFEIVDGFVESLNLSGVPERARDLVAARLRPLLGQRHLRSSEFQRRVLLLGEISGLTGGAKTSPGQAPGGIVLSIESSDQVMQTTLGVENNLPKGLGTWSFPLAVSFNNALGWGENIHAEAATGSDYSNGAARFQAYGAGLTLPVLADGLAFSAGIAGVRTAPTVEPGAFPLFPTEQEGSNYQKTYTRLTYPVLLTLQNVVRLQVGYDHVDYQVKGWPFLTGFNVQDGALYGLTRDRYDDVRLAGEWITHFPWEYGGSATTALFLSRGVGGRGASVGETIPLSRPDASPTFTKLRLDMRISQPLPEQFTLSGFLKAQTSFGGSLMLPENLALDGPDGVSGFASGTINVDTGAAARIELSRPIPFSFESTAGVATPYLFASWGRGVHESLFPIVAPFWYEQRAIQAEAVGGGAHADVALFGGPFQESLHIEFAKSFSNIPYMGSGYRTNLNYVMKYAGTPSIFPVPTTRQGGGQQPIWTGLYAGLNAGYSAGGGASGSTASVPILTFADVGGDYSGASALSATGQSKTVASGFLGGAQFGANSQFNRVVVGLETDIQGSGVRGRSTAYGQGATTDGAGVATVTSAVENEKTVNWLGTTRVRAGFLTTPTLLVYGTGGVAYGGVTTHTDIVQAWSGGVAGPILRPSGARLDGGTVRGGWTAGAGVEWMFAPNLSLKGEYLYYDLGSVYSSAGFLSEFLPTAIGVFPDVNGVASRQRFNGHILRAGLNYHFGSFDENGPLAPVFTKSGPLARPRGDEPRRWDGVYAGLNVGYAWNTAAAISMAGAPVAVGPGVNRSGNFVGTSALAATGQVVPAANGYVGGAQVGYNALMGRLALGAEADFDGAGVRGRASTTGAATATTTAGGSDPVLSAAEAEKGVDWLATLRARAGYLATPGLLAYGTAGLAIGGVNAQTILNQQWAGTVGSTFITSGAVGDYAGTRVGWTAGAGLEWMLTSDFSLKAEYLYYDLGSAQYLTSALASGFPPGNLMVTTSHTHYNGQVARVGLNYHFNTLGALPTVVAKY